VNGKAIFRPVQRVRAYEAIVSQVEEAIRQGELQPGARLSSERDLMVQFGVSRSTVREALRVLESNGLVRSRPGEQRGAEILAFSAEPLAQSIRSLVQIERLTLYDLIFFRMLVEGTLSGLAAAFHEGPDLEILTSRIERMQAAVHEDSRAFSLADVAFHEGVAEISGNRLLIVCNEVVRVSVSNLIAEKIASGERREEKMDDAVNRHSAVYHAIRSGDAQKAIQISRTNIYEYYSVYLSQEERDRLRLLLT
jgi:DNA-binding FadR family transcriptional regulator